MPGPSAAGADHSGAGTAGRVVAFVFTDLVGSTESLSRLGEEGAEKLRRRHFGVLRTAVAEHDGVEVKSLGDGLMVAFENPAQALEAAVAIQVALAAHNDANPGYALSVRIGVYAGVPTRDGNDYFGTPVVIAKRLCDAARGGQILAGEMVEALVAGRGFRCRPIGPIDLKGISRPMSVVEVGWRTAEAFAPAASTAPSLRRRRGHRGLALVGRTDELARLQDEFTRAAAGQLRFVLICGEPGVGKTRLSWELLALHAGRATTLEARAHQMAGAAPFGLWADALDPHLQEFDDDQVEAVCGGYAKDLAGLFHRVGGVWGDGRGAEPSRRRLMTGLSRVLIGLARRDPVVILFDDVHWADASSWELLRELGRRMADARVLVVLTARDVELAEHEVAREVLFELQQDGVLTRLELAPLDEAGIGSLAEVVLNTPPPTALVSWLTQRSRGNALFALGLLQALLEEGADLSLPRLQRIPEGLAERVTLRLRRADQGQLAIVELLVVLGRPVLFGELELLTGRQLEELADILGGLVAGRAVVEAERGRMLTYEVVHPLVRDVVYEQIGAARRRLLHRQTGRVLRDAGRLGEAALHFARAAEPGDSEAVEVLLEAMREAEAREAVREALALLAEFVELLPAEDGRWLEVLDAMNWQAEWLADHRADSHAPAAVTALRRIDGQLGQGDSARRAVVKFRLSQFLAFGFGDVLAAEPLCGQARDLFLAAGDTRHALLAARELAWFRGMRGDLAGMQQDAATVAAAAEAAGETFVAMHALATVSYAAACRGRYDEYTPPNERALAIGLAQNQAYRSTALLMTDAFASAMQGRMADAERTIAEAIRGNPGYRDTALPDVVVGCRWFSGDNALILRAAADVPALGSGRRRPPCVLLAVVASAETGDLPGAERDIERVRALVGERDWWYFPPQARWAEAVLNRYRGQPAACLDGLRAAADEMLAMGADPFAAIVLIDLAETAAEAGAVDVAAGAAADLCALAGRVDRPLHHGLAASADAWAALVAGDRTAAAVAARAGVEQLGRTEARGYLARAHEVLGRCLDDRAAAAATLAEAARIHAECSALWRRDRVLELLRGLGKAGGRAAAAMLGPASLTARELDVARLAANGATAKEIAATLFVGERTVETHLARIYAKTGVSGKLDLIRRAAELGLE